MKADNGPLDELTYLLESGSDRIGALDFQCSATEYVPRGTGDAALDELVQAAERVEKGLPLSPELGQALQHGTSLGGARPKAQIDNGEKKYIAKFSSTTDLYSRCSAGALLSQLMNNCYCELPVRLRYTARQFDSVPGRHLDTRLRQSLSILLNNPLVVTGVPR